MTDFPSLPELPGDPGGPGGGSLPPTSPSGDPLLCGLGDFSPARGDSLGFRIPLADEVLDIGAPEADMDGDGFMEAVTLQDERGLTVYTDSDGDRAIDQVSTVRFDGTYDTWQLTNARQHTAFGGFANGDPRLNETSPRWECTDWGTI